MAYIAALHQGHSLGMPRSLKMAVKQGPPEEHLNSHKARYSRQTVMPMIYSFRNPLLLPLRADLIICGSHTKEYVTHTNTIDKVGDRMTRTIKVKKMKSVTPKTLS
jgi:hypothetical protein